MSASEKPPGGTRDMTTRTISRRAVLRGAGAVAAAAPLATILAPALSRAAAAAPAITMRLSTSQANDPKYANGRVYYDELMKQLAAMKLDDQIAIQFFPDNQLGQEIDVANSVKLGVIDLMVTGTSIWANLVPSWGVADGVRRDLYRAAGRRARRARARSADHRRQQVLRDGEILHPDRAHLLAARHLHERRQLQEDGGAAARRLPRRGQGGGDRNAGARPRRREGGARGDETAGRRRRFLRQGSLPLARAAAARKLQQEIPRGETDPRRHPGGADLGLVLRSVRPNTPTPTLPRQGGGRSKVVLVHRDSPPPLRGRSGWGVSHRLSDALR